MFESIRIRAMDGPTLTQMAFDLGLAPEGSTVYKHHYGTCILLDEDYGQRWEPHENLQQSEAVFRRLRTKGWHCARSYSPHSGAVSCARGPIYDSHVTITVHFGLGCADTEAMALLRCAVLAMAPGGP